MLTAGAWRTLPLATSLKLPMNMESQNDIQPVLEEEIRRFETDRIAWLRFSPELEERYSRETKATRGRTLLAQGLFSLLVYDFFLVGDYFMTPQHIVRAAVIRLGIFTPLVMLVVLAARLRRSDISRETSSSLLCFLAAFSVLYLHRSESALVSIETQMGLTLVLLVMLCVYRMGPTIVMQSDQIDGGRITQLETLPHYPIPPHSNYSTEI